MVPDPEDRLPAETLSAAEQRAVFAGKGFTTQELVAILGAHTVISNAVACIVSILAGSLGIMY